MQRHRAAIRLGGGWLDKKVIGHEVRSRCRAIGALHFDFALAPSGVTLRLRMKLENPFPGMNPWLELSWETVHVKLIGYIADAIDEFLPPDLRVRAEEGVNIGADDSHEDSGRKNRRKPDVAITEPWKQGIAPGWTPAADSEHGGALLASPKLVLEDEVMPRWLEICTSSGELVTVIEVLSPSNKSTDRDEYLDRQHSYLQACVNLVEIDLLLSGKHTIAVRRSSLDIPDSRACYLACVVRDTRPRMREVYETPLRERLKPIAIPLRPTDKDVILDLQPLIDRCYKTGRYWQTNYRLELPKPLNAEDAAWATALLQEAGFLESAR